VLHLRGKTIDHERVKAEEKINRVQDDDDKKTASAGEG
jgi:hypothetical protein